MSNNVTAVVAEGRVLSLLFAEEETETTVAGESGDHSTTAASGEESHSTTEVEKEPSPLAPDMFELAWAAGSFLVLLALMR